MSPQTGAEDNESPPHRGEQLVFPGKTLRNATAFAIKRR
jgi:hypothetical protein